MRVEQSLPDASLEVKLKWAPEGKSREFVQCSGTTNHQRRCLVFGGNEGLCGRHWLKKFGHLWNPYMVQVGLSRCLACGELYAGDRRRYFSPCHQRQANSQPEAAL